MTTLKLVNSKSTGKGGFVLFGTLPEASLTFRGRPSDWLERWFPTKEKAKAYAESRGFLVDDKTAKAEGGVS